MLVKSGRIVKEQWRGAWDSDHGKGRRLPTELAVEVSVRDGNAGKQPYSVCRVEPVKVVREGGMKANSGVYMIFVFFMCYYAIGKS